MEIDIINTKINDLKMDLAKNCRARSCEEVIQDYAELITEGVEMPPVTAFVQEGESKLLLADGYHRCMGAKKAGRNTIKVEVFKGGPKEALIAAISANAAHGLRRTNADKQQAVKMAFSDEEIRRYAANRVAQLCKVSQPTVDKIREEMKKEGVEFPETTVGRDGKARRSRQKQADSDKQDKTTNSDETLPNDEDSPNSSEKKSARRSAALKVCDGTENKQNSHDRPENGTVEIHDVTQNEHDLEAEVIALREENAALKAQIEKHQSEIYKCNRTIGHQLKALEEQEREIDELDQEIEELKAKLAKACGRSEELTSHC